MTLVHGHARAVNIDSLSVILHGQRWVHGWSSQWIHGWTTGGGPWLEGGRGAGTPPAWSGTRTSGYHRPVHPLGTPWLSTVQRPGHDARPRVRPLSRPDHVENITVQRHIPLAMMNSDVVQRASSDGQRCTIRAPGPMYGPCTTPLYR